MVKLSTLADTIIMYSINDLGINNITDQKNRDLFLAFKNHVDNIAKKEHINITDFWNILSDDNNEKNLNLHDLFRNKLEEKIELLLEKRFGGKGDKLLSYTFSFKIESDSITYDIETSSGTPLKIKVNKNSTDFMLNGKKYSRRNKDKPIDLQNFRSTVGKLFYTIELIFIGKIILYFLKIFINI